MCTGEETCEPFGQSPQVSAKDLLATTCAANRGEREARVAREGKSAKKVSHSPRFLLCSPRIRKKNYACSSGYYLRARLFRASGALDSATMFNFLFNKTEMP